MTLELCAQGMGWLVLFMASWRATDMLDDAIRTRRERKQREKETR